MGTDPKARARPVLGEQSIDQRAVADVALHEDMPRIATQRVEVVKVAGVGQRIEVDDGLIGVLEPVEHEVAADETGAAGDEDGHLVFRVNSSNRVVARKARQTESSMRVRQSLDVG